MKRIKEFFADNIAHIIAFSIMGFILFIVFKTIGLFHYEIDIDTDYKYDGYENKCYVWHNGEIVASDFQYKVPPDSVACFKKRQREWAQNAIKLIKSTGEECK